MPPTTSFDFGDVVLVPFPFTDQSGSKKRPSVVVSSPSYNQQKADVVLMPVTSQQRVSPTLGETPISDWQHAGLVAPSLVKPLFATLEQRLVMKKLGRLSPRDRDALEKSFQHVLGTS